MLLKPLVYLVFYLNLCTVQSQLLVLKNNACKHLYNYPLKDFSRNCYFDLDVRATVPEIIERKGYKIESHFVTTPDGYILQLFRVIDPNNEEKNKQPVFLEHGILLDSGAWLLSGEQSIVYSLVKDGYDVWLGNHRGTRYSRGHIFLKPADKKYWDFTLDTVAASDTKAVLNEIAKVTKKAGSIIYIGQSRGTTLALMFASEHPEEAKKLLRGIVALAPVIYLDPHKSVRLVLKLTPLLNILKIFGSAALFQNPDTIINLLQALCPQFPYFCKSLIIAFSGKSKYFSSEILLNLLSHYPASLAFNQLIHFAQLDKSGRFQKFDYGRKRNREIYHQDHPPVFDLGKVTIPVFLFYGKHDILISKKSVEKLFRALGSTKKDISSVPVGVYDDRSQFNHNDFYWGKDLTKYLYKDLIKVLKKELQPEEN